MPPALAAALAARGYVEPTPVQAAILAADAGERDLLVTAQTGSGKTVAYGLAAAPSLLANEPRLPRAAAPLALVVAPTRELAQQVRTELDWLYAEAGGRVAACIGGMDARAEARALAAGAHIVVGTPGRLCDHLTRGRLDLSGLRVVVLDEADEMLDMGFREELETLLAATPEHRRALLFSATMPPEIADLARRYQTDALRIDTRAPDRPHADIDYRCIRVTSGQTRHAVVNLLRWHDAPTALVFCATRDEVRHLHAGLLERGFASVALSGELTQAERGRALEAMREGLARVCVATDVAARGLDLPHLNLVIHADLPNDAETLLHRSGRTGRAGRKGTSLLIVPAARARRAESLLRAAKLRATWDSAPSAEAIRARDGERLLADPMLSAPVEAEDAALARALLEGRTPEDIAAAFVRLHRARLPAPEDLTPVVPASATPREPRAPRPAGRMAWFSVAVGRSGRADPKWLVPLICRAGGVSSRDIGAIRIFDRETKFEIRADLASAFAEHLARTPPEVRIHPANAPQTRSTSPQRESGRQRS